MKKYQNKPFLKEEFKGIHVDVWYEELEHLEGQHVWKDDCVYKVLKDQEANTEFNLDNLSCIATDIKLLEDANEELKTVTKPAFGDTVLSNNKIYTVTLDETDGLPDNGFVIVASLKERYYHAAIECAESVKLFWPEAHITVFVDHEEWIRDKDYEVADWIVTWGVPKHIRAKLWALGKTPYKGITCYLDADMYCEHEDVENIFDLLPDDLDLLFTKIRPYNAKVTKLTNTEEMTAHCGMFLYRNNPHTIKLMEDWYGEYVKQNLRDPKGGWVHDLGGNYPDDVRKWDTFTMWRLLTYGDGDVKWDENMHIRWNFINGCLDSELEGEEVVFWHYTIPEHEVHRGRK